jgi:hypothetical protein
MTDYAIARCHCGGVELQAHFPSRFCAHCYCGSCRRTHAAGVVTWMGFKRTQVTITKGQELIRDYFSSAGTNRKFCGECGTRLMFESDRGKWAEEYHLPLGIFVTAVDREPTVNAFEEERPAWAPFHPI